MSTRNKLADLAALAQMVQDRDMARLQKLATAREQTRQKLAALSAPVPLVSDPALFTVRQRHLHWAQQQRLALNAALARQTAALLEERRRCAKSLGRADVLARLARDGRQGK